jgi:hypothetical protein
LADATYETWTNMPKAEGILNDIINKVVGAEVPDV